MDYNITFIEPNTYNVKMDNIIKLEPPQESLTVKSTEEEQVIIPQNVLYNKVIVEKFKLQTKEIEPQQSAQVVVADEGYDGLKQVNINASGVTDMLQARVDATNSCKYLFYEYEGTNVDFIKNLNTSNVTDMSYMFQKCEQLTNLNLSNFDTRNVTNMSRMFNSCTKLTSLDLSNFDTRNVKGMTWMFHNCRALTNLDLSNFNTSQITTMYMMFSSCVALTSLNLSSFNTSNVTDMQGTFGGCNALTSLDLSSFDTSKVTSMSSMFGRCSALTNLNLSSFDTSKLTSMSSTPDSCYALTRLDLSSFDTSKVTSMYMMFKECHALAEILGTIDMINVTNCNYMFQSCYALTNVTLKNIKTTLTIGTGTSWGHLLTLDCLINTIKELWDYSSGTKTYTLTIGSANIEKIANTYVKLITPTEEQIAQDPNIVNKKHCEVCESTDEGAMTLTEYATSKRWAIG